MASIPVPDMSANTSLVDSVNVDNKDEMRIEMETEANFVITTAPAGVFTNSKVRNDFVRKVYSILCLQMTATTLGAGIMYTYFKEDLDFKRLSESNDKRGLAFALMLLIGAIIITLCISLAFCLSVTARRAVPLNFILLGLFTIAETVLVGVVCCQFHGQSIIISFALTAFVVLIITLLAMTPWFDITNCGLILCILAVIHAIGYVVIMLIVMALGLDIKPWMIALSVAGAFIYTLYLLYDTQLILGGRKYELNPEEYVFGAICLYLDIIQIFLNILQIVGNNN